MKILGKYDLQDTVDMVVDAYKGVSTNPKFTAEERLESSRLLLKELVKNKGYRRNKIQIFEIVERALDEILPKQLDETIGRWADVQEFAHGDKPQFSVRSHDIKAYFVAEGGRVPRKRIYDNKVSVATRALQIEVYEELARVQAGDVDFNEIIDIAVEEFDRAVNEEIYKVFAATYNNLPTNNKVSMDTVDKQKLNKLIQIVGSYGRPVIMGTRMALAELPLQDSEEARSDLYNSGYVGKYNGVDVIALENAVTDTTNSEFQLDNSKLFILPEGKEKIVKVALEGDSMVRDDEGADWTLNFMMHRRAGVAVVQTHHMAVYNITSLE